MSGSSNGRYCVSKDQAEFAGVWLRTRHTHLPISFSEATVKRFCTALVDDPEAGKATRAALIKSYEGDQVLYNRFIAWWLEQRKRFLGRSAKTPCRRDRWRSAGIVYAVDYRTIAGVGSRRFHPSTVGVVTDDVPWWDAYARTLTDSWYRWKWVPTSYEEVLAKGWWARSLTLRRPINDTANWGHAETYHSAPGADPERYLDAPGVMMTYPIGRQFAVSAPEPIGTYRAASGLTVVHHFALNENDEGWEKMDAQGRLSQPFQAVVGYAAVDVDRAGPLALLGEARAVAYGDPRNIALLCGSSFSTGFPMEFRQFMVAFQSVPALPSKVLRDAASDAHIVVREIKTPRHGTYYLVVNPTWSSKPGIQIRLPAVGQVTNLVTRARVPSTRFHLDLAPADLHAFRVN